MLSRSVFRLFVILSLVSMPAVAFWDDGGNTVDVLVDVGGWGGFGYSDYGSYGGYGSYGSSSYGGSCGDLVYTCSSPYDSLYSNYGGFNSCGGSGNSYYSCPAWDNYPQYGNYGFDQYPQQYPGLFPQQQFPEQMNPMFQGPMTTTQPFPPGQGPWGPAPLPGAPQFPQQPQFDPFMQPMPQPHNPNIIVRDPFGPMNPGTHGPLFPPPPNFNPPFVPNGPGPTNPMPPITVIPSGPGTPVNPVVPVTPQFGSQTQVAGTPHVGNTLPRSGK